MRIEINTGWAGVTVHQLTGALNSLENKIDEVVDSFQAVRKKVSDVKGGVGQLSGALSALDRRIAAEKQKKKDVKEFGKKCEGFIKLAINRDNKAERLVNINRLGYYIENFKLSNVGAILTDCLSIVFEKIGLSYVAEAITTATQFVVDFIVEFGDEILTAVIIIGAVVGVVLVSIFTGGAVALILGAALIGVALGAGIAGYRSYKDDGDVDLWEVIKGALIGGACGAAIGACLVGSFSCAKLLAGGFKLLPALGKVSASAVSSMAIDVFRQTVVNPDSVGFENYSIKDTLTTGIISFVFSAITFGFDMAIGDKVQNIFKPLVRKFSTNAFAVEYFSMIPFTVISSGVETYGDYRIKKETGELEEGYSFRDFGMDWLDSFMINMIFNIGDANSKVNKPTQTPEINKPSPVIDDPTPGKAAGMDNVNPSEIKKVTVDGEFDVNTNKPKFDQTADGLTFKQSVPEDVDKTFSAFSAEVKSFDSSKDYFSADFSNIERGMAFKDALGGENIKVRSIDLDADMYVKDGNLFSSLNKQLSGMDAGDTLKIVLDNKSLRAGHIGELNSIFDIAKDMNVSMEIHSMVLSFGG